MGRDVLKITYLLSMLPPYAASSGIGIGIDDLLEKWKSSGGSGLRPLEEAEFFYLVSCCVDSRFLWISRNWVIQITQSGHDYLQLNR